MADFEIMDAVREQIRLRMLIDGPSGSGKTATGLMFATAIARRYGGKVGVIASENVRDLSYVGTPFAPDGFKRIQLNGEKSVSVYRAALNKFKAVGGFSVVFIDSLSHAWAGPGGLLEEVETYVEKGNEFAKWHKGGKIQNALFNDIISAPFHVIATLRTETENVLLPDPEKPGKTKVYRVGTKPVQRKGVEYEFGIYCRMDSEHNMTVVKTDCSVIDRIEIAKPTMEFMEPIFEWLDTGAATTQLDGVRIASDETLGDYIRLAMALGYTDAQVRHGFREKYGAFVEDVSEEFLRERIEELGQRVAQKTATASVPTKRL